MKLSKYFLAAKRIRHLNLLLILFFVLSISFFSCKQNSVEKFEKFVLKEGDLLFQDLDSGPLCEAIEKVTFGYKGYNISHIGIVVKNENGKISVLEAIISGVQITPLKTFLSRSLDSLGNPKVIAGRLKEKYQFIIPDLIKECKKLIGSPYDKIFKIGNDNYYCSELIYEASKKANNGVPIFELQPMTFKDPQQGIIFPAWDAYFSELHKKIPEGEPGINPAGISLSSEITIINIYGNLSNRLEKKR